MNETVIYSIFKNGSDAAALAGLIEVLVLAGFFTFLIIRLRHAKRNGHPRVSRKRANHQTVELSRRSRALGHRGDLLSRLRADISFMETLSR